MQNILKPTNNTIPDNDFYSLILIAEALRKYPPLPNLNRRCALPYKVPDSDLVVEKEINVLISAYGIHHDPDYYPDPEKFDPERFSEENKTKIPSYAYLPFGEGPRNCIGTSDRIILHVMCINDYLLLF